MLQYGSPVNGMNRGVAIQHTMMDFAGKHSEMQTVNNFLDQNIQYKGLMKLWNQFSMINTPLISATELAGNVEETNGFGSTITYSVPFKKGLPFIKEDLTGENERVGWNREKFPLVLNTNKYTKTDILTYDRRNGIQVIVANDEEVEPLGPDSWKYMVYIKTDNPNTFVPKRFLQPGINWFKISNARGVEWATENSSITYDSDGIQTLAFQTGETLQSLEHWITMGADILELKRLPEGMDQSVLGSYCNPHAVSVIYMFDTLGDVNDPMNPDRQKNPVKKSGRWMPTIVEMLYREQAKMQENHLTWNNGGIIWDGRGVTHRVGMGLYPQLKMGWYETYSRTSEILTVLKKVTGQLFFGRSDLPMHMRRVVFEMGMGAFIECQKAFNQEFKTNMPFMMMADHPSLKGLVTGDNMNLRYGGYRFMAYNFPEAGNVEIVHNPALDFEGTLSETTPYGRYPMPSYSILVKDLTDPGFSNAIPKGNAQYNVREGFNNGSNIVMLKPKNYADTYVSYQIGDYCPEVLRKFVTAGNNAHISSGDFMGFKMKMFWAGEIWVKDPSRIILIERNDPLWS